MKRLLVIILISGAFFGGYHLGHKEGSPDITGWVQQTYPKVVQAGQDAVAAVSAKANNLGTAGQARGAEGNLYRAATEAVQRQVQSHPEWDPRYWNAQMPQTRQP